jgi:hypothetical protein
MIALRAAKVHLLGSNIPVDSIMNTLQEAFEAQCQVDSTGEIITDEDELKRRKIECTKAGLYALRSIHTAWLKYPAVGGRLEGAPILAVDFGLTAMGAPVEKPEGQLGAQYARIMADAVDPAQNEPENWLHAQLRVNDCFLAVKKQFMALFSLLDHDNLYAYMFDDDILSEDDAPTKTYTLSAPAALHPPSTTAYLMSAKALQEAAKYEDDDNQHIFVTGGVLRTKAEKKADLAVQVDNAKKVEVADAARARVKASASKTTAKGKGKGRKSDTPPVESEDEEEEEEVVETPAKKAAPKKAAAAKVKGGKKAASPVADKEDEEEEEMAVSKQPVKKSTVGSRKHPAPMVDADGEEDKDVAVTKEPVKKSVAGSRKRPAPAADADEADEDDIASKPAPKKRAKSTPATKKSATDGSSSVLTSSSNASAGPGSVAPKIAKRGGAAPKWLKDEDDLVKKMIVAHPDWPMPAVYRAYSLEVANTPYQRVNQANVEYRADFVEFPKGIIMSDKERRKYDIGWRTYESVRQHCESFKAHVSKSTTSAPYNWDACQDNVAAGLPKRAPPPRPAFFNNDARTPVPSINTPTTLVTVSDPVAPTPPAVASTATRKSSDWTAINRPLIPSVPNMAASEAAPAVDESAEDDAESSDLEDFVANQSE